MSEIDISKFLLSEGFDYSTGIDFANINEADDWCREKFKTLEWISVINKFYFKNKEDCIQFKLMWK